MVEHTATVSLGASTSFPALQYADYPDWPKNKFAYESDGTLCIFAVNNEVTPRFRSQNEWATLNSYEPVLLTNPTGLWWTYQYYFLFPEPREVTHVFGCHEAYGSAFSFYASTDTTNGWDGTWTAIGSHYGSGYWYIQRNRVRMPSAVTATVSGAVGVRVNVTANAGIMWDGGYHHKIHLYGTRSQDSDRLALWHPTRDEELEQKYLDWGTYQFGSDSLQFRVKNMSPTKRSLTPSVYLDQNYASWGTRYRDCHTLSYDGSSGYSVSLPTLQSKEVSELVTLTRDVPYGMDYLAAFDLKIGTIPNWQTYIHNVTSSLVGIGDMSAVYLYDHNTAASLTTNLFLTDGSLYTSSRTYREQWPYTGSTTTQVHAGSASLSTDGTVGIYIDAYSNSAIPSLYVTAEVDPAGSSTMSASVRTDLYADGYSDEYGTSGLFAVATVV